MSISSNKENQQKIGKNKKLVPTDIYNKLNESKPNARSPDSNNNHNNIPQSAVDKNTFEKELDHTEEKIQDMSYIHRDIQMRLLKTKKEPLES